MSDEAAFRRFDTRRSTQKMLLDRCAENSGGSTVTCVLITASTAGIGMLDTEGRKNMTRISGQFTVKTNPPTTGRAHLVVVECDLCKGTAEFDPKAVGCFDDGIYEIITKHQCKKPEKPAPAKKEFEPPPWGMNSEDTRRERRTGRR